MCPEETVVDPYVVITPKNYFSAYRLWASIPRYRLKSIWGRKPVFLKKDNIKSAQLENLIWIFVINNDDHEEILIHAHHDEVQGGFEQSGPDPTPWKQLFKQYFFRSPSLLSTVICFILVMISLKLGAYFQSAEYLAQYPIYNEYPQEFLLIVKTRIIFWGLFLPLTLTPLIISLISLSGRFKSRIGRIQAVVKVESWLMLIVFFGLLLQFPLGLFFKNWDTLSEPLDHPRIEEIVKAQRAAAAPEAADEN